MQTNVKTLSFNILQNENNSNLIIWTFPSIASDLQQLLLSKCFHIFQETNIFYCLRKKQSWIYIKQFCIKSKNYAICLVTTECDPQKYKLLCDILCKNYEKQENPVELVRLYLKVYATGCCSFQENGSLISCDLKHFEPIRKLADLIRAFNVEIVLIYTGLLLKRRLLVYDNSVETLQQHLLTIASLSPSRHPNEYLQPFVENVSSELKSIPFYLAGTINEDNARKQTCYDLFINLQQNEVIISPRAKDVFAMTKVQKDIALTLVQLAEDDIDETKIIEAIKMKTDDILSQLYSLTDNKKMLTINELKSRKFNPKLENFLFNLAIAEGIMMV